MRGQNTDEVEPPPVTPRDPDDPLELPELPVLPVLPELPELPELDPEDEPPDDDPPDEEPPEDEPPPFPPPPPPPRRLSKICSCTTTSGDRIASESAAFGAGMLSEAARGGNSNTVIAGIEQRMMDYMRRWILSTMYADVGIRQRSFI